MTRIVYVGHFDRNWTTETHIARDLERLGHLVERIDEPNVWGNEMAERIISATVDADLLLITRTNPIPTAYTKLWRLIEKRGTKTASIHLDLYWGLSRESMIADDPYWRTGTVFTADGDPRSAAKFAELGINHVWSPAAIVSDECTPGTPSAEFVRRTPPIVFVGQQPRSYPREWTWRAELLTWLKRNYGRKFAAYPGGRPVRGRDLNNLYAATTVVVGDTLAPLDTFDDGVRHQRYWSDRVYETVGRGGFLLFPNVEGIAEHFTDGEHLRLYEIGNVLGLRQMIDHYLAHPDEARSIARAGQAHVLSHHTYMHRMIDVLTQLGLPATERRPAVLPITTPLVTHPSDTPPARAATRIVEGVQLVEPGAVYQEHGDLFDPHTPLLPDPPMVAVTYGDDVLRVIAPGAQASIDRIETKLPPEFSTLDEYPRPPAQFGIGDDRRVPLPIRLELGSGYSPTPGFVHLDLNPNAPDVDIVGPVWPLDLPDESCVELRAVDVLEHVSYWDTSAALVEWARVLVPGGRLFVQVPDADRIMRLYVAALQDDVAMDKLRGPKELDARTPLAGTAWRLLGGHSDGKYVKPGDDWRWNAHYSLWSQDSLRDALYQAGLSVESIETNGHPNVLCWAVKR